MQCQAVAWNAVLLCLSAYAAAGADDIGAVPRGVRRNQLAPISDVRLFANIKAETKHLTERGLASGNEAGGKSVGPAAGAVKANSLSSTAVTAHALQAGGPLKATVSQGVFDQVAPKYFQAVSPGQK